MLNTHTFHLKNIQYNKKIMIDYLNIIDIKNQTPFLFLLYDARKYPSINNIFHK